LRVGVQNQPSLKAISNRIKFKSMAKKKKTEKVFILIKEYEESDEIDVDYEDNLIINSAAITQAPNVEDALKNFLEMHETTDLDLDKNDSYSIHEVKFIKKLKLESKRSFKEL
jgi:hypothetical protein